MILVLGKSKGKSNSIMLLNDSLEKVLNSFLITSMEHHSAELKEEVINFIGFLNMLSVIYLEKIDDKIFLESHYMRNNF